MSTGKHIDKICIAVVAFTLVLTLLFMCGSSWGLTAIPATMKYESTLFDTSYVHEIDIVMDDWDTFIASCEDEEYASCTVVVDGEKHSNIAIRAKGNTSLSNVSSLNSQRYSFKLEFDHYEDGKSLDGLDKLCLNNLIQDNTMMKDYIVYQMMNEMGVDTPLCSYAYLTVNGEDWGLYLAVEGIEDSFLSRNYGSDTGDLYKPDSMSFGGGRGNGKDFDMDSFDFNFDSSTAETEAGENTQTDTQTTETQPGEMTFPGGGQGMTFPGTGQQGGSQSGDMISPEGWNQQMPTGEDGEQTFDFPDSEDGTFPTMEDGAFPDMEDLPDVEMPDMEDIAGNAMQVGVGGMGSDDVKLKYIDDDPDSYSNIFDNAKTDVTEEDEQRLIASLKSLSSYEDLDTVLDMDEVLRYFVVHNFVCNGDSYTGSMIHNYYLRESDGELSMIPWDYNLAFGTFQGGNASDSVNADIDNPVSGSLDDRPMVGWIFSDEVYTEQYHDLFRTFLETWFADGELETLISETADMIRPYVEKDPTKFCTTEEFEAGVTALTQFVNLRAEAVTNQLNGDDTAVSTDGLNLSDMGTMQNGGGGGNASMPDMGGGQTMPETGEIQPSFDPNATENATETTDTDSTLETLSAQASTETSGEQPQMPSGNTDGTMPQMPGGSTDGTQPQMPNGDTDGKMPQMSSDTAETATSETETQAPAGEQGSGTMPQMPGGSTDGTVPTMPEGTENGEMPQMPDGTGDFAESRGTSAATQWILTGVSVLVLAIGLLIAIKKKY